MSPPSRTGSTADDKPSYTSVQLEELISNQPSTLRTASPKLNDNTHGFLTTTSTRTGPVRPLSPDTLSDFSFHEYPQSSNLDPSPFPPPSSPSSPSSFRHRLRAFYTHNLGLLYMLLAQLFGTAMNVATRLLEVSANHGRGMHPLQILFTRMALTVICGCAYMSYTRTPHFPFGAPEVRRLLVVRGFAGFFGVFGMYYSLMYLPLAEATVITFLAPGLASWACSVLLGEPFTRAEKIGGGVSLLGVVLIARPAVVFEVFSGGAGGAGGETAAAVAGAVSAGNATASSASNLAVHDLDTVTPLQRLCAVGVALVGVLGAATAYTVLRWIGKRAHPLISVNYFATTTFFVCLILQSVLPEVGFLLPSDVKDWGWLVFLGVCGFVMQYLLVSAFAYEKSSRATNLIYVQMLFALGADRFVFGHSPGLLSIVGSSLILGSAIVVALQKNVGGGGKTGGNDAGRNVGGEGRGDEESQIGLLNGADGRPIGDVEEMRVVTR